MPTVPAQSNAAPWKILALVALIVGALVLLAVFLTHGSGTSGTVQPKVQQMNPGARGRKH